MTLKKAERKTRYMEIQELLLCGLNREAFDKLSLMAADDVGVHCLADYEECVAKYRADECEQSGEHQ